MPKYDVSSIEKMDEIEHIRKNSGMYVGGTEDATRLLEEVLDNSLDEIQGGHSNIIAINIDSENKTFEVIDNGRGIPFDQRKPLKEDPPILICTSLFTSGKFRKIEKDSAYKIASGLHGVGLSAVYALSDEMIIEICRNKKMATYKLFKDGTIERSQVPLDTKQPFSTRIFVKPNPEYFSNTTINVDTIEERLYIACANYPDIKIALIVDGNKKIIKSSEDQLIEKYLGKNLTWHSFISENNNNGESCILRLAWDDEPPLSMKAFTTVNLVKVHDGYHINRITNTIKNYLCAFAKKNNYDIQPEDCLNWLRLYMNLKILKTSFEAQVKVKLEKKSDLSIMDNIEKMFPEYIKQNDEFIHSLMDRFQDYRKNIETKKAIKSNKNNKRSSSVFTKLRDCLDPGGELIIGEGESAVNGLIRVREPKKHAILPLKGVIVNSLKKNISDLMKNVEVKDIIQAIGCGIGKNCDITKLRYEKIILAADADPAGHFITTLLIVLFAHLAPDIIKNNKLWVCKTPLYGYKENKEIIPLWTDSDLEKARNKNKTIMRFKGLGEFNPDELKSFILDEKNRILIPVSWTENYQRIFDLMVSSKEKRKLVLGEWKI